LYMLFLLVIFYVFVYFFFFQAEDGIRDRNVTGVQTCALPILAEPESPATSCSFIPVEIPVIIVCISSFDCKYCFIPFINIPRYSERRLLKEKQIDTL